MWERMIRLRQRSCCTDASLNMWTLPSRCFSAVKLLLPDLPQEWMQHVFPSLPLICTTASACCPMIHSCWIIDALFIYLWRASSVRPSSISPCCSFILHIGSSALCVVYFLVVILSICLVCLFCLISLLHINNLISSKFSVGGLYICLPSSLLSVCVLSPSSLPREWKMSWLTWWILLT